MNLQRSYISEYTKMSRETCIDELYREKTIKTLAVHSVCHAYLHFSKSLQKHDTGDRSTTLTCIWLSGETERKFGFD